MPDTVRARLKEQFNCTCQAWYSNEENGIMGLQLPDSNSYYINSESYFYEILKMDSDEPAEDGELGRVVITDLTNYAFPILRYDNGDTAVAHTEIREGRKKLFLTELYGRRSDLIYDTSGHAVTPYIITNNFWDVQGVAQYQFIQTGLKDYELRLNGDRSLMNVDDMLGRILPTLGEDANINVVYVDEIPVLASGKRKYIENRCPEYQR
jgi:phenylacetate-CoA ligase